MRLVCAIVASISIVGAPASAGTLAQDREAMVACVAAVVQNPANSAWAARFGVAPGRNVRVPPDSIPTPSDVRAIETIMAQLRSCRSMGRAMYRKHNPHLVLAYAVMEARIDIVRMLLRRRRLTFLNTTALIATATAEFFNREQGRLMRPGGPPPDDRALLRALRTTAQTANTADTHANCGWQDALIVCGHH